MNSRAYSPPGSRSKVPLLVLAGSLAFFGALVPVALHLDGEEDSIRHLYKAREDMAWIQHLNQLAGGTPEATSVGPGETFELADKSFTTAPGVSVSVRPEDEGFCVRASNDEGKVTEWLCHDPENPPQVPSGDPLADL